MRAYKTTSCSVVGYRKKAAGLPCEDATRVVHTFGGTVIAVADGHGDRKCVFASIGAGLATRAACDTLKSYLKDAESDAPTYWNSRRSEIAADIARRFALYVLDDYEARCAGGIGEREAEELRAHIRDYFKRSDEPMSPTELREKYLKRKKFGNRLGEILLLYGTTVRASVLTDSYIFNCALGDGDTVGVIDGHVEWLLPQAEAFSLETASLCEPFAIVVDSFLFSFIECRDGEAALDGTSLSVQAVMLSTDGFRNSFLSTRLFEKKVLDIEKSARLGRRGARASGLKRLYERLSMESFFQDDISTIIAVRAKKA